MHHMRYTISFNKYKNLYYNNKWIFIYLPYLLDYYFGLLQLKHNISSNELYLHHYSYLSALNQTMTKHFYKIMSEIENLVHLDSSDIVLDIRSNKNLNLN